MWRLIYNIGIWVILPFFAAFSLTKKKIRSNFLERLFPLPLKRNGASVIWIHAASLGEAVIAENLIRYMCKTVTGPFLITTNTHYTRDLLKKRLRDTVVVRSLPFDLPFSINRFMASCKFAALILIETEIWPNLIWMAKDRGLPVIIVNGRISDATVGRYRKFAFFLGKVLASVDLVLAQSEEQSRRFALLGMSPAKTINTGNLKYYREFETIVDGGAKAQVATFGSIKEKELPLIVSAVHGLKKRLPNIRIFVVPREMGLSDAIEDEISRSYPVKRYSSCKGLEGTDGDVVLVDTVGDLMGIYRQSSVAFVGGSLAPYGGQNVLEPLFAGTPVVFGPYIDNFRQAAETIVAQEAGFMVQDGEELVSKMLQVLENPDIRNDLVDAGRKVLAIQKGTMERAVEHIMETIWKNSQNS